MGLLKSDETSVTLLTNLTENPINQAAWERFVAHYQPRIRGWCRQGGLQTADAEDVTQDVLLRLTRALPKFTYDPSRTFRGWLRLVTEHALADFFADRKRRPAATSGEDRARALLERAEAHGDLLKLLNDEFTRMLVVEACRIVCARVEPKTWEAFRLTMSENRPGEEVAALLGMKVPAVFKAKSRVLEFIREEIKRLDSQP